MNFESLFLFCTVLCIFTLVGVLGEVEVLGNQVVVILVVQNSVYDLHEEKENLFHYQMVNWRWDVDGFHQLKARVDLFPDYESLDYADDYEYSQVLVVCQKYLV